MSHAFAMQPLPTIVCCERLGAVAAALRQALGVERGRAWRWVESRSPADARDALRSTDAAIVVIDALVSTPAEVLKFLAALERLAPRAVRVAVLRPHDEQAQRALREAGASVVLGGLWQVGVLVRVMERLLVDRAAHAS